MSETARAQLTHSLTWGWQGDARQNAAASALTNILNRYNAYGDFTGGNGSTVEAAYNPGVPTAQAGYGGWGGIIEYGGTWPNDRVTMHELDHWLGTGTYSNANGLSWNGPRSVRIMEQFDGVGARVGNDGVHFWPYGMNYDNEWSELAAQRNVALIYALRADWGIGSTANPTAWNATSVSLVASDPAGASGFNHGSTWSDNTFAHPNADYSTGAFALRTPNGYPSWDFAGRSLTVNSGGRLLFNGWGTAGIVTFKQLNLQDGSTVRHDQFSQDLFQLAGNVTLAGNTTFDAANGPIRIRSTVDGSGSLTKTGTHTLTLNGGATYAGATVISAGTLKLEALPPVARYTFDTVTGSTVYNTGSGAGAMNGTLTGSAAIVPGGQFGNAVSLAGGASVDISNSIANLAPDGSWTVSAWVKTNTPGSTILSKSDGGWANGNTIFYLGDGTAGGSGGIPSGVRWAGGFFQGAPGSATVTDNSWHHVTYVNNSGAYAIYVDGVPQPLSPGNSSFGNADIGSLVRLGATTNTVPSDGTVHFNGLLDDVQVFNQALSAGQVASLQHGAGVVGSLPSTTDVTIASGATLDLNGFTQQIGSLSGDSGATVLLSNGQLIVNTAADSEFAGAITGRGGAMTKEGSGNLTITGAAAYGGATTINGGALTVTGSVGSFIEVNSGGTLMGSGTVSGSVFVADGGVVAPGESAGALTVASIALSPASALQMELGGTVRGTQYDALLVTGNADLGGTLSVTLTDGFAPVAGDAFDLIDWAASSGNFAGLSLPSLAGGLAWNVTNLSATGELSVATDVDLNDDDWVTGADFLLAQRTNPSLIGDWQSLLGSQLVTPSAPLTAVPEPAACTLAAIGAALVVGSRWRSRRLTRR